MLARCAIAALLALAAAALPASAQPFPSKPVHLVVAYAPGGTGDVVARIIADRLGPALGQTVVVENRAGASGAIGATSVLNAAARRPHAAGRADRRDRGQSILDQGADLRSEGPDAGRARDRGAARAHDPRQGALRLDGRDAQSDPDIGQAVLVRVGRHRHAGPSRRRVSRAPSCPASWCTCPTRAPGRRSTTSSAAMSTCISRGFRR